MTSSDGANEQTPKRKLSGENADITSVETAANGENGKSTEDECIELSTFESSKQIVPAKRRKANENEDMQVYLENMPCCDYYEKSYMHRDSVIDLSLTSKTGFIITSSIDGHVKFWKKMTDSIEFVKHFRAHLGRIMDASCSHDGSVYCTVADDKTMKVFDVSNYDMCNMINFDFQPNLCQWIFKSGDATNAVAVTEKDAHRIFVFDGKGPKEPLKILDKIHRKPISALTYNIAFEVAISADVSGMLEYWNGPKGFYDFPEVVQFEYKTDTDLYEVAKAKSFCTNLSVSNSGKLVSAVCFDKFIRIFKFLSGKLYRTFDETSKSATESQQQNEYLSSMEFGKRLAVEKDLQKSDFVNRSNVVFDESDNFILYPSVLGVKVVHIKTKGCVKFIGQSESLRLLSIALYQDCPDKSSACLTMDMQASKNPTLDLMKNDPCLFSCAFKQKRFYIFSNRDPQRKDGDRDVLNEKPTKEEQIAASGVNASGPQTAHKACIHTVLGDIHLNLFPDKCPKTVENFVTHARNGYYNNHIFHRVIKAFMVQTGDPTGTGMGGESIWGHEFADEFHPSLRHDKPYTLSMANSGPATNASQFFITVVPTPWLDDKHTVFGRAYKGLDVVKNISEVRANPRTEKPYEDVKIINISTT